MLGKLCVYIDSTCKATTFKDQMVRLGPDRL